MFQYDQHVVCHYYKSFGATITACVFL